MGDQVGRKTHLADSTIQLEEITQRFAALLGDLVARQVNRLDRFILLKCNTQRHQIVILETETCKR